MHIVCEVQRNRLDTLKKETTSSNFQKQFLFQLRLTLEANVCVFNMLRYITEKMRMQIGAKACTHSLTDNSLCIREICEVNFTISLSNLGVYIEKN